VTLQGSAGKRAKFKKILPNGTAEGIPFYAQLSKRQQDYFPKSALFCQIRFANRNHYFKGYPAKSTHPHRRIEMRKIVGIFSVLAIIGVMICASTAVSYGGYQVTIKTGCMNGAGTDADVYIKLIGKKGETQWVYLDKPNYNDFERCLVTSYGVSGDVGEIYDVRLRVNFDGKHGDRPNWFCEWVKAYGKLFPINKWYTK
jgi:hypothetical protein